MEEIAELLKFTREESGIELEEVSKDLEISVVLLKNIESGKIGSFKDIFLLKEYISDYAKYLGLDYKKILDEFNEYLFDMTSKIPIDLIEKAKKEKKDKEVVISPYTKESKKKIKIPKWFVFVGIFIILVILTYVIFTIHTKNDFSDSNVTYSIRR